MSGPHNDAYDLDGKAPTLTSKPTIVFDDRVGQFRKLSVREMLRVQGMPESFQFPPGTSHANATALIEKGMDPMDAIQMIRDKRRGAINRKQVRFLTESYQRRSSGGAFKCCTII